MDAHTRSGLAQRLKSLRVKAGYTTGKAFALAIGWPAPKVSKIENGRQAVSENDLATWMSACSVPTTIASQLQAQRTEIHAAERHAKQAQRTKTNPRSREDAATRIRGLGARHVPDLLQTPDYARHLATARSSKNSTTPSSDTKTSEQIEADIGRLMLRQRVLLEPGRHIDLLVHENALTCPALPADVLQVQAHRLLGGTAPGVRVGILPATTLIPWPDYMIIDDQVLLTTPTGDLVIDHNTGQSQADWHHALDQLWTAALDGASAHQLVAGIATPGSITPRSAPHTQPPPPPPASPTR